MRPRLKYFPVYALALFIAVLVFTVCTDTHAGSIGLTWDPVPEATSYRVYYSAEPSGGIYPDHIEVTDTTLVFDAPDCMSACYAVKAVNEHGESAEYSDEICGWPQPEIIGETFPVSYPVGFDGTVRVTGNNFHESTLGRVDSDADSGGTSWHRSNDTPVNIINCTTFEYTLTIGAAAPEDTWFAYFMRQPSGVRWLNEYQGFLGVQVVVGSPPPPVANLRRSDHSQ